MELVHVLESWREKLCEMEVFFLEFKKWNTNSEAFKQDNLID